MRFTNIVTRKPLIVTRVATETSNVFSVSLDVKLLVALFTKHLDFVVGNKTSA